MCQLCKNMFFKGFFYCLLKNLLNLTFLRSYLSYNFQTYFFKTIIYGLVSTCEVFKSKK